TPASGEPVALQYPPLFPQLLDADIQRYASKAHVVAGNPAVGHNKCLFPDPTAIPPEDEYPDIFPPGYVGAQDPLDKYSRHTATNSDHIYYCEGDIHLRGKVH